MAMNMATQTQLSGEVAAPFGAATQVPPALEEIARHFPNFELLECLGRGGMGVVYRARQKSLNRLVALKILAPERVKDAAFAQRFALEAETLARLNHPGVVTIYDFGQADGLFYLAMEFVDGVTLRRLLERGRMAPREALAIIPQICDALQYAHDQGVVHRDIKPENILLDRRGRVKVADFGVAKLVQTNPEEVSGVGANSGETSITEAGKILGTPSYMAPEQVQHPAEVDHRADIYALGVVLYQMLTGELPGPQLQPPSKKVQIDVRLDEVVLVALEKDRERRYQQASEVKTAIETITKASETQPLEDSRSGSKGEAKAGVAGLVASPASGQRTWLYAFAAGILAVLLFEFAASALIMEARPVAFALALPAAGIALVILFLAPKKWVGGFLGCVVFVFLLWLAVAGLVQGPLLLGLMSGTAALATFLWVIRKCYFPPGFLSAFLIVHLIVFGAGALVTVLMPESFVSTVRVEVQRNAAPATLPVVSGFYDPYFIQTEFELIQSQAVLGNVIQELDLRNKWGQRYSGGRALTEQESLALLKKCMDLRPVRNTSLIEIRVFSDFPDEAAAIANQVALAFQGFHQRRAIAGDAPQPQVVVQIVDLAKPGVRPVRPNKPLNLAIGALAGLLLGALTGNAVASRRAKKRER
jgi:capsular polysaccharide biosynthesis protein/predicted Ser/Thr protein kinase